MNADISGNIAAHFFNHTTEVNRKLAITSLQEPPATQQPLVSALEEIANLTNVAPAFGLQQRKAGRRYKIII